MTLSGESAPSYLIVNADDFGYFKCVSKGIVQAHTDGIVTATGVLGNSPDLDKDADLLKRNPELDAGVHLNLTFGRPLTPAMTTTLEKWNGEFPSKFGLVRLLIGRRVTAESVEREWAAQIERCLDCGLKIRFANSHEHVHMLPGLTSVIIRLAERYRIDYVRWPMPDAIRFWRPATLIRDLSLLVLGRFRRRADSSAGIRFLGMGESGRLSLRYLARQIRNLRPGGVFELMCHPGIYDSIEIGGSGLERYHDWDQERKVLTSEDVSELLLEHNVRLIGFRDIQSLNHA